MYCRRFVVNGDDIRSVWKQKTWRGTYGRCNKNNQRYYWLLLYRLVSTRAVIGQFCGPYSTVQPAKFLSFLRPINLRDIINILLISFFSVRAVSYGS